MLIKKGSFVATAELTEEMSIIEGVLNMILIKNIVLGAGLLVILPIIVFVVALVGPVARFISR